MIKDKNYYIGKSIFITATNTDVGKTYASEKFLYSCQCHFQICLICYKINVF